MGMKQILVMMVAVVLVGCGENKSKEKSDWEVAWEAKAAAEMKSAETAKIPSQQKPTIERLIEEPIIEMAIRTNLGWPKGELTEADLEKVTYLSLPYGTQLTDNIVKELDKLQQLRSLSLASKSTDTDIKLVVKLQNLTQLNLSNTQITSASIKEVVKL